MVRKIDGPGTGGGRRHCTGAGHGLLLLALLVAVACDPNGASPPGPTPTATVTSTPTPAPTPSPSPSRSPSPTPKPSPKPTKTPFVWALLANGFNTFVQVTEAPAGSVCSAKAFLKSGKEISGPALSKARTVTSPSQPVSWSDQDGQLFTLPSPAPPSGSDAYWQITCVNNAFNPSSGTTTKAFPTP